MRLNNDLKTWKILGAAALISCSLFACKREMTPDSPTSADTSAVSTPSAQASPSVLHSPDANLDVQRESTFVRLTETYEVQVAENEDGYPILKPLLSGQLPPEMGEDLQTFSLETPEQQDIFDTHLLPILEDSFSRRYFVTSNKLEAGDEQADFRTLRHLVNLLTTRADQVWKEGDNERALALASLPLQLSASMRNRPETVSVNLFSSNYAESTLILIPKWIESEQFRPQDHQKLLAMIQESAPSYSHLQETVSVDFAQLSNSLQSEKGRENLGIGRLEPSTLKKWLSQLNEIYSEAIKLYTPGSDEGSSFNERVLKASTLIQGLVIDYPQVATMQRHSFAKYKSTELGLALLGPEGDSLKSLSSEEVVERVFASQVDNLPVLKSILLVEHQGKSLRVMGKLGKFELLAPGVSPIFFEFHPDL